MSEYVIEMRNIVKKFKGIVANDNINLQLKKGEIHALLGENGAGKSTLMSVLFGLYQADSGEIYKNGEKVIINDPNDANDLGIGMVHQHFKLVEVFSVLDNIILGAEKIKYGMIDRKTARKEIEELCNKYEFNLNLDALIEDISVGMQQKVEIIKMLYRKNDILIFDEPTAVLTPNEIQELMKIMRNFAKDGKSILFITHKLEEIKQVADRCTILRKGKYIKTVDVKDVSKEELSKLMVGREVELNISKKDPVIGETILKVNNLCIKSKLSKKNAVNNVSFSVRKGEIVCIAGIDGNGQSELIYGITGIEKSSSGSIEINNENVTHKSIKERNSLKLSHIPEDRHKYGLILDFPLDYNIVLKSFDRERFCNKTGFLKFDKIREYSDELIRKYDIRTSQGSTTIARSMSGGNQQKAIVGRELEENPDLLIAVQPTRGLDVGAIEYIHKQIVNARDNNKGVLLVSFELDEVMNLADRILVMYEGEIVGQFDPKKVNVMELGLYMSGAKRQEVEEVI